MALRSLFIKAWFGYLLAGVFLLLSVYFFFNGRAPRAGDKPGPAAELAAAVTPVDTQDVVRFTSTLNLAQRMGADLTSQPLFRAGVKQAIDRSIEFKVSPAGKYQLVMQMTDTPFVDQQQAVGEYLEVVREGQAVGQTVTAGAQASHFGGLKVKLEARGILTGQPADTAPDAPITATLYTGGHEKIDEVVVPVEQAGLNDAWRWVDFPFDVPLSPGSNRTFLVEFTSPAQVTGWALSRVTNGFGNVDDHYPGGELLINGKPPEIGPSADLTFAVLARSSENKQPRLAVDETVLTFTPLAEAKEWLLSEPVELNEGVHLLIVQSSNPHLSFFRFIFVPESDTSSQATLAPSPASPSPGGTP